MSVNIQILNLFFHLKIFSLILNEISINQIFLPSFSIPLHFENYFFKKVPLFFSKIKLYFIIEPQNNCFFLFDFSIQFIFIIIKVTGVIIRDFTNVGHF